MAPPDLGPLPDPPADLALRELPLTEYNSVVFRLHPAIYNAVHFGKTGRWRFDDPERQYGVFYAAETPVGAFAETLLPAPGALTVTAILSAGTVPVSGAAIDRYALSKLTFTRSLRCVDLRGPGLAQIDADGRLATGDRSVAQRWGRALFAHPSQPEAIMYRSRRDPDQTAFAVHERAQGTVLATQLGALRDTTNLPVLREVVQRYRIAIVPS